MSGVDNPLAVLQKRIDSRVRAILESRPAWPCRKGCDHCCRNLAAEPLITASEWAALQAEVRALEGAKFEQVAARARELRDAAMPRPITCPLLDPATGACLVYSSRPLRCRTYGFYAERDGGLYCGEILRRSESGEFGSVVWGNHESLERETEAHLGEAAIPLFEALAESGARSVGLTPSDA